MTYGSEIPLKPYEYCNDLHKLLFDIAVKSHSYELYFEAFNTMTFVGCINPKLVE